MSFYDLFDSVNSQNTTLKYDLQSKQSSPPLQSTTSTLSINLNMMVPQQQKVVVNVPFLESFKLAYMQYVSFLILCYIVLYKLILGCAYERKVMGTSIVSEITKMSSKKYKKNWLF